MGFGEFLVERDLAVHPARGERQNDEMPLDPPFRIARDCLTKSDQIDGRNLKSGFLPDFAYDRFLQGLAKLYAAAG